MTVEKNINRLNVKSHGYEIDFKSYGYFSYKIVHSSKKNLHNYMQVLLKIL